MGARFQAASPWPKLMVAIILASWAAMPAAQAQLRTRPIQAPAPYEGCNVRSGGGVQYAAVGTFRNGTSVTLLGESGAGWYRVQVGQIVGWMARQCLGL